MKIISIAFVLSIVFSACTSSKSGSAEKAEDKKVERIVSLGGTITEILYELGSADELVAVDVTSTHPAAAEKLTNLGHVRGVTFENILSAKPTKVIAFKDEVNPQLLAQLQKAKVEVTLIERTYSVQGAKNVINAIAKSLGKTEEAKKLNDKIDKDLEKVEKLANTPKVLFVYARGTGTMMVAGDNTPLSEMIKLAGGVNATGGFEDFKPLTTEGVIAANPDVILMFDSGEASLNSAGGILGVAGVKATTAGKNKAVITMDGQYLSGFGPRMGKAVADLNSKLNKIK